jgi:hypothetical protein
MSDPTGLTKQEAAALRQIPQMTDAKALRALMSNANAKGSAAVYNAAFRRLAELIPGEAPGTLEHDFWQTTLAYEQLLTEKNGKTTKANYLRRKVARVGVLQTMEDLALAKGRSDGFTLLVARGLPELTAEAIILKHSKSFSEAAVNASRQRLEEIEFNVSRGQARDERGGHNG